MKTHKNNIEPVSNHIRLVPLNKDNWLPVCRLSVSEEQKQLFPIPNVYWIGISRYEEHTDLFAIKQGENYVGLIGGGFYEDGVSGCINPLMVDCRYQGLGAAASAMKLMLRYLQDSLRTDKVYIGHRRENHAAARLYDRLGFLVTEEAGQDVVRCLQLGVAYD